MEKNLLKMLMLKNLIVLSLVIMICGGCNAPTYPKKNIAESLVDVCRKEFDIDVQVKLINKNIVVFLPLPELFDSEMEIVPEAVAKIEDVILVTSRVIFSTDAEIDFYTLITADISATAAELILVRNVDDLLKYMNGWLRRAEFSKRVLWKINFNPNHLRDAVFNFDNIEEMLLPDFLAGQIAQRINFKKASDNFAGIKVEGVYSPGESQFIFSLLSANKERFEDIYVPLVLETALLVLRDYKLNDFAAVKIVNQLLEESVIISNAELKRYQMQRSGKGGISSVEAKGY